VQSSRRTIYELKESANGQWVLVKALTGGLLIFYKKTIHKNV
jgi:hypothetical protein